MPFAKIRGQEIFYSDSGGTGPLVLLAHGFLMTQAMFVHQVAALSPEFRVVCWDERGFGQTVWDKKPFSYWDSAEDALALLDHLGVEKAIVGGMSQGGFLSLRAALKAPERIRGLVLMATQAGVDSQETLAGYKQMVETWTTVGPLDVIVETIASLILGTDKSTWEPWVSDWKKRPKEDFREPSMCLLTRDDITSRVGEITAPAIVFHGTADHAITMDRAEELVRLLPNCKGLVRVEGGAHAANLTHPDQVNPKLVELCRSL